MSRDFKIITWNVNSIRVRLPLLKTLIELESPDIICLQEVKAKEEDFPFGEIQSLGFEHVALYSMAGYNGVAILSKTPLTNVHTKDWYGKSDARHISATIFDKIELHNIYIPAGGDIPNASTNPAFAHKLSFIDELSEYFEKNNLTNKQVIVCGDFNIAPLENDVWSHKEMSKTISHTPIEIEKLSRFFDALDFVDVLRKFYDPSQKLYSWWGYRNIRWKTNDKGRRLDHIWATQSLEKTFINAKVLKDFRSMERPSDHIPVIAEFKLT